MGSASAILVNRFSPCAQSHTARRPAVWRVMLGSVGGRPLVFDGELSWLVWWVQIVTSMGAPSGAKDAQVSLVKDTERAQPDSEALQAPLQPSKSSWAGALNLAEAGLLTDVGLTLDLASIYLPVLGAAFIPLTPAPFAILYLRRGARVTMLAALVAGFLMTVLTGPHFGWRLSLQALVGMAMGIAMRRQWRPLPAIALGTLVVSAVAYGAAFGGVFVLGLPLHDLYLGLANALASITWILHTCATLVGAQALWAQAAPWVATITAFVLRYWTGMFAVYVAALALPTVILYYGVASTTAYALGHQVKPFPAPWVWGALRITSLALSPLWRLLGIILSVVTAPLWGPVWLARWVARRRRMARLRRELARRLAAEPAAEPQPAANAAETAGTR